MPRQHTVVFRRTGDPVHPSYSSMLKSSAVSRKPSGLKSFKEPPSQMTSSARRSIPHTSSNLRVARVDNTRPPYKRHSGGIFITRLDPNHTAAQVKHHIKNTFGYNMIVDKLKTKRDSYSSFHIDCNENQAADLLQTSLWPKGLLIKPFISYNN